MKYKYRLVEQEEPGGEESTPSSKEKIIYDLVLTPRFVTVGEVIKALEDVNNYGPYISNIRNTKADVEKAIEDHFGPSQPFMKKKAEKLRGKPFPPKTKIAIDSFIRSLAAKPTLLKWTIKGDRLIFPADKNPSKKATENIIRTVLDNAKIQYNLESKENQ